MIRVVIDTNILISALLQPEGLPAAVLMLTLFGEAQLCVSDAIYAEYDDVIRRPHLKRPGGAATSVTFRIDGRGSR
jgi:putative PIN family toxin of toxin-antitoxin system